MPPGLSKRSTISSLRSPWSDQDGGDFVAQQLGFTGLNITVEIQHKRAFYARRRPHHQTPARQVCHPLLFIGVRPVWLFL